MKMTNCYNIEVYVQLFRFSVLGPGSFLDLLDLEMETNQGEYKALEVQDQIVETSQTVRVMGLVHINQAVDLASVEAAHLQSQSPAPGFQHGQAEARVRHPQP